MSENIDTFLAITGSTDSQIASNFLEMSGDNLETAISLFFEHGASFGQNATSATGGSGNGVTDEDIAQMDIDDDARFAERLQNETYSNDNANDQGMRAPIESTTERLVGDVFPGVFGGVGGAFNPLLGMNGQYRDDAFFSGGRRGVFNQREQLDEDGVPKVVELGGDGDDDDDEEEEEDLSGASATQRRLQRLFRPPFDLISKLDLEAAKLQAHKNKKWLMINLQDNSDFQCQCLNRDFWSQFPVKEIVRDNFLFLQYATDSRSGENYSNFYPVTSFPHIAILDPITGERVKQWSGEEGVPKPDAWIKQVKLFLNKFSLDPSKVNPVVDHGKAPVDLSSLTEEQQLEYAISQSLGNKKAQTEDQLNSDDDDDDSDLEILNTGNESDPIEIDESEDEESSHGHQPTQISAVPDVAAKQLTEEEIIESITAQPNVEPEAAAAIRIQIRSGTGSRVVRKFSPQDTVLTLYQFVKDHFSTEDRFFTLTSPQRENLVGKLQSTLQEAGLANSMVLLDVME